jgi:hypothetical protein
VSQLAWFFGFIRVAKAFERTIMTQSCKILWFTICVAALLLLPGKAAAQVYVTPTVQPTPPGLLITVNNGPGDENRFPL